MPLRLSRPLAPTKHHKKKKKKKDVTDHAIDLFFPGRGKLGFKQLRPAADPEDLPRSRGRRAAVP